MAVPIIHTLCTLGLSAVLLASSVQAHPFEHFFAQGGHHGPRGFQRMEQTTIADIKRNGRDDEYVILRGSLTKYYGDESYEFRDGSGDTIEVKLDDDEDWSYLSKDEPIFILGKLDVDWFSLKVDVKRAVPVSNYSNSAR
ncbi:MAG: NirD/YgiW/YdeI family stress tolerance protein [Candidatus Anaerobiospirillum merdipullorum]|uniref:NirD/YgiW/YdeI family stress tolerance protein n=1 Tax=Candidatus Anaerobiospirillum merdipullorum TaxID=2838450 RepID=A0A9E2KMG7_9GAMM|nr:NirD/YgiW/YdeI family stress tolerance protein [Candidatus Anaerobiospirillum merdipullorum]